MGATRKGAWVQVGEKGVYDFEQCQDSSAKEKEVIHDSVADGPFCETALQRKRAAVAQAVKTGSQSREKAAAQGAQLSMSSLLATVHQHAGSGLGSKVSKHGAAASRTNQPFPGQRPCFALWRLRRTQPVGSQQSRAASKGAGQGSKRQEHRAGGIRPLHTGPQGGPRKQVRQQQRQQGRLPGRRYRARGDARWWVRLLGACGRLASQWPLQQRSALKRSKTRPSKSASAASTWHFVKASDRHKSLLEKHQVQFRKRVVQLTLAELKSNLSENTPLARSSYHCAAWDGGWLRHCA